MEARVIFFLLAVIVSYAAAAKVCAGCPARHDPSQFDKEKLTRVLSTAGSNEVVSKVVSVSTQVVSGVRYVVVFETVSGKTCKASWIDIPWESKLPQGMQLSCRAKRSLSSDFQEVDEREMADMVSFGEAAANQDQNGFRKVIVKMVKAQKKVVQGTTYRMNFIVKTTACKVGEVPDKACLDKEVEPRESCDATLFMSPYMLHGRYQHEVMSIECKAVVGGRLITGHDQEDMEFARNFAVSRANQQINSMFYKGLYKVVSVDETLSAGGKLYTFKFILRDTDCKKNENTSENCPFKSMNRSQDDLCSVTVWYLPSTKFAQFRASACSSIPQ